MASLFFLIWITKECFYPVLGLKKTSDGDDDLKRLANWLLNPKKQESSEAVPQAASEPMPSTKAEAVQDSGGG
ncbi:MAG: hypothetical protein ACOX9C_00285 [Kiritimatiellia bacterium]